VAGRAEVAATDDLVVALKILGGFAAVGLVLPVSLLALDPVPTFALARFVVTHVYRWPHRADHIPRGRGWSTASRR